MSTTKTKPAVKLPIIRHCEFIPGGIHYFEMDASRRNMKHVQEICVESGAVRCSCEHFTYKLAPSDPTLATPELHCKHISSAVEWLLDNGHLEESELQLAELLHELRPCDNCFMPDAEIPLCDEQGRLTDGFMCRECLAQLRLDNEHWSDHAQQLRATIAELDAEESTLLAEDAQFGPELRCHSRRLAEIAGERADNWHLWMACEPIKEKC
ncbi:hypothetical protein EON83_12410 [bacterium]|nr:MAG: hypothetical protein EON83_12410 [bacterium]